jgi:hypothetical protein
VKRHQKMAAALLAGPGGGSPSQGQVSDAASTASRISRTKPKTIAWSDGNITRVRIGAHSDGKYGLRVWNAAGKLEYDETT